jgi:hypothetical protein
MAGILDLESLLGLPFPGGPSPMDRWDTLHRLANSPYPAGSVYDFLVGTLLFTLGFV